MPVRQTLTICANCGADLNETPADEADFPPGTILWTDEDGTYACSSVHDHQPGDTLPADQRHQPITLYELPTKHELVDRMVELAADPSRPVTPRFRGTVTGFADLALRALTDDPNGR